MWCRDFVWFRIPAVAKESEPSNAWSAPPEAAILEEPPPGAGHIDGCENSL
jgi:hypothetical protein